MIDTYRITINSTHLYKPKVTWLPFISCNKYKKARGLVVLGEGKGAVML